MSLESALRSIKAIKKHRRDRERAIVKIVANAAERWAKKEQDLWQQVHPNDLELVKRELGGPGQSLPDGADDANGEEPDSLADSTPDSESLPRGASDYRPGPAAEAARGRR